MKSAFVSSEELWRSRRLLFASAGDNTLLDLHNSPDDTQPHSLLVIMYHNKKYYIVCGLLCLLQTVFDNESTNSIIIINFFFIFFFFYIAVCYVAGHTAAFTIVSIQHKLQTNRTRPYPAKVRANIRILWSRVGEWVKRRRRRLTDSVGFAESVINHEEQIDLQERSQNV